MKKASSPEDIAPVQELVELPVPQNGKTIVLLMRGLALHEMMVEGGGLPVMGSDGRPDEAATTLAIEGLVKASVLEPKMSFGADEPGRPRWNDLVAANQRATIDAMFRLSGGSVNGDAAAKAAAFPARIRRGTVRAGDPEALPAGPAPASRPRTAARKA